MKYVLDSSVALKWVLPEADSARAIRLRDEYQQGVHELLAPDIFTPEIANALASAERQGRIKTGESAISDRRPPRRSCDPSDTARAHPGDGPGDCDPASRLRLRLPRAGGSRRMRTGDSR